MSEKVTITLDGDEAIRVERGDRYEHHLPRDEALWVVACILMGKDAAYLRTQAEHDALEATLGKRVVE